MSFDNLFILPNEDIEQSGGHEPFMILKYTGSDTLSRHPELPLIKPYLLSKKEVPTTTVDTLEGYEAATGLSEGDIMAVNGDAFLQILENQSMGGGLEKHLFFNPNNAAMIPIEDIIGEQVIFLTTFHQLYFLASINKLGLPTLNATINERFDALKALLKDEQYANVVFGVPHKDMSDYFTEIQNTYVGHDDVRQKSFADMCELILGEPTDILKYFKDAVTLVKGPAGNAGSAYTGTSTRRGFNSISLASGTQNGHNDGNTPPVPFGATADTSGKKPTTAGPNLLRVNTGATSSATVSGPTGVVTGAPKVNGNATGAVTGAPKVNGNATGAVTGAPKVNGDNNDSSVSGLLNHTAQGEGKEGEDDNDGSEGNNEGNAGASKSGSSSSGNPRSVANSRAQEGSVVVNARRNTAVVPGSKSVQPPKVPRMRVPKTNRTLKISTRGPSTRVAAEELKKLQRKLPILEAAANAAEEVQELTKAESMKKKTQSSKRAYDSARRDKSVADSELAAAQQRITELKAQLSIQDEGANNYTGRANTGLSTEAVIGHGGPIVVEEEGPNLGYVSRGAVTGREEPQGKAVGFRKTGTALNTSGFQSLVETGTRKKKKSN